MAVVRWVFHDPSNATPDHTFAFNPADFTGPSYEKSFVYQATAAPEGRTLVFEGRDTPKKITWNGTVYTQAEYEAMVLWWGKRNQIEITDDLGRTYSVITETFNPKRRKAYHFPWCHDYEASATIVDWS